MTFAALASYADPTFLSDNFPAYADAVNAQGNTWGLASPTPYGNDSWDASDVANEPVLKTLIGFELARFSEEVQNSLYFDSPTAILQALAGSPANFGKKYIIIGYTLAGEATSHVVVPYKVDQAQGRIYIYDPDHPDADGTGESSSPGNDSYSRYLTINETTNTWEYIWDDKGDSDPANDVVWPDPQSESQQINLFDVTSILGGNHRFTPIGFGEHPLYTLENGAELLLTNPEHTDQMIGLLNHAYTDSMDYAQQVNPLEGESMLSTLQHYYFTQDPDLTAEITGTSPIPSFTQ